AADLAELARRKLAELERPEGDADQPGGVEAEMGEDALHLAVLALAQSDDQPDVASLDAVDGRLDRSVENAIDGDPVLQPVEVGLGHRTVGAHAIAAEPAGRRKLEDAREAAVIG